MHKHEKRSEKLEASWMHLYTDMNAICARMINSDACAEILKSEFAEFLNSEYRSIERNHA
jgi:hypothetical protein